MSLLRIGTIIGRGKVFILKVSITIALAASIVSLAIPSWYTASTTILPPQQNSSSAALLSQISGLGSLASAAGSSLGLKNPNEMHVSMLKSRTVEDAMIHRFELQKRYRDKRLSDTRKDLEKHFRVESGPKDSLIKITVEDKQPKAAAEMANAYIEEYNKLLAGLAIGEAAQRRLFFEQQLVKAKDNLAGAEEELKKTESKTGVIQLDSQARALIESVAILRAQIAAKEVQIQTMSSFSAPNNPELQLAQHELAALKVQLQRLGSKESADGDLIVPSGKVPQAGLEYVRKLRDVKYYETIFELLARQFEMAKLDEAKEGVFVQVVDAAVVPDRKSYPKRALIVVVAFVIGVIGSIAWVIVRDAIADAEGNAEQARQLRELKEAWVKPSPPSEPLG